MDIEIFRKLCSESKIHWSTHGLSRMQERNISMDDVINLEGKIIHTVCGIDNFFVYIVTAYFPNKDKFSDDLKTRRKK